MPEKTRVVRRPEGEPNYHIFYQLLSGADSDLRRMLGLENLSEPNLFMTPLQRVSGGGGGGDGVERMVTTAF